jgi:hypothetical protein
MIAREGKEVMWMSDASGKPMTRGGSSRTSIMDLEVIAT